MKAGNIFVLSRVLMLGSLGAFAASRPASSHAVPNFDQLSKAAGDAREANHEDEAIPFYQKALALKPDWQEGLWYLGSLLYEKEQYAGARDVLRRFVVSAAETGPGWALLGMSEFQTREYGRAL